MQKKIMIDTNSFLVILKCNLRCKLCCTFTGPAHIKNPPHFSIERLKECAKKYFETIDFVRKMPLTGGEPMLTPDLHELIEYINENFNEQFDILEVLTNGTLIPNENILNMIERYKEKMLIFIDHYGEISNKVDELVDILEKRSIKYTIRMYHGKDAKYGGWVDLGDFNYKHDENKAKNIYKSCFLVNTPKKSSGEYRPLDINHDNTLYIPYMCMVDGILAPCGRSHATLRKNIISDQSHDSVNLMDKNKTKEQLCNEINELIFRPYLISCQYCNGFLSDSKRFLPAEQI